MIKIKNSNVILILLGFLIWFSTVLLGSITYVLVQDRHPFSRIIIPGTIFAMIMSLPSLAGMILLQFILRNLKWTIIYRIFLHILLGCVFCLINFLLYTEITNLNVDSMWSNSVFFEVVVMYISATIVSVFGIDIIYLKLILKDNDK